MLPRLEIIIPFLHQHVILDCWLLSKEKPHVSVKNNPDACQKHRWTCASLRMKAVRTYYWAWPIAISVLQCNLCIGADTWSCAPARKLGCMLLAPDMVLTREYLLAQTSMLGTEWSIQSPPGSKHLRVRQLAVNYNLPLCQLSNMIIH